MSQHENNPYKTRGKSLSKIARFFAKRPVDSTHGNSWDARHLTSFLSQSHYSNWHGNQKNISQLSLHKIKHSPTEKGTFKEETDDRNCSKIGFTPIFPLVSNTPVKETRLMALRQLLQWRPVPVTTARVINGNPLSLRCQPENTFKFEGNAVKFKHTDPLTIRNQIIESGIIKNHQKQRISRLIKCRYPHGMIGIDHPQNTDSVYYDKYQEKVKVRQQPNTHNTFVIDRDWKQKKKINRASQESRNRRTMAIRKFRNSNTHEYNILTNRKSD